MRVIGLLCACVVAAGCAEPEPPPLFNAVDPTLQCPTGSVGWSFSTGGPDRVKRNPISDGVNYPVSNFPLCSHLQQNLVETCASARSMLKERQVVRRPTGAAVEPRGETLWHSRWRAGPTVPPPWAALISQSAITKIIRGVALT